MMVLKVCRCGRTLDAITWASLHAVARRVHDGNDYQARRCACGAVLEVTVLEDDAARTIVESRYASIRYYALAGLDLGMARYARAAKLEVRLDQFRRHRAEARAERKRAVLTEQLLDGIYRSREVRAPKRRIGRNLQVVAMLKKGST